MADSRSAGSCTQRRCFCDSCRRTGSHSPTCRFGWRSPICAPLRARRCVIKQAPGLAKPRRAGGRDETTSGGSRAPCSRHWVKPWQALTSDKVRFVTASRSAPGDAARGLIPATFGRPAALKTTSGSGRATVRNARASRPRTRSPVGHPLRLAWERRADVEGLVGCKSRGGSSPLRRTRESPASAGLSTSRADPSVAVRQSLAGLSHQGP